MTKALRSVNGWWIRHAWSILAVSFVALIYFVSVVVLGQNSPSGNTSTAQSEYSAKQNERIKKLEDEVSNLSKALDKQKSASRESNEATGQPTVTPSSTVVTHKGNQSLESSSGTGGADGQNDSNGPSDTQGPTASSTPRDPSTRPTTPPPAPPSGAPSPSRTAILGPVVQSVSCDLVRVLLCR